jgi:branched-chain amino acid transport system ATP-binding protein
VLDVREVDVSYGHIEALKKVSLTMNKGELVTIIGANGAGKSTLVKCIVGIVPKSSGEVYFEGQRVTGASAGEMIRLGITLVPEGRRLFGPMSVVDNLNMGAYLRIKSGDTKNVKRDLERVFELFPRLKERTRQAAGSLSGGEQQMLAIGRGLMAAPKVMLLDEPSLGLAPLMVRDIFRTLTELRDQGIGVLLIEQNAKMSLEVCDRAYVLELGNVIRHGSGPDLLKDDVVRRSYLGAE